jgi:hypothetical protein
MNWFRKYAQPAETGAAGTPGAGGQTAPAEGGTPGMRVVFRGEDTNRAVFETFLSQLNAVPAEVYDFLGKAEAGNPTAQFLVDLAASGRLSDFTNIVKSYTEQGVADSVATGTVEGLEALQAWYGQVQPFLGADPFGLGDVLAELSQIRI